jgi:hypothetical protein
MLHTSRSASLVCEDLRMGMVLTARTRPSAAVGHRSSCWPTSQYGRCYIIIENVDQFLIAYESTGGA